MKIIVNGVTIEVEPDNSSQELALKRQEVSAWQKKYDNMEEKYREVVGIVHGRTLGPDSTLTHATYTHADLIANIHNMKTAYGPSERTRLRDQLVLRAVDVDVALLRSGHKGVRELGAIVNSYRKAYGRT